MDGGTIYLLHLRQDVLRRNLAVQLERLLILLIHRLPTSIMIPLECFQARERPTEMSILF